MCALEAAVWILLDHVGFERRRRAGRALIALPVSWPQHWVWCVPLLILWSRDAWRGGLPYGKAATAVLWLALLAASYWVFSRTSPGVTPVFSNILVAVGVVTLVLIAIWPGTGSRRAVSDPARPHDLPLGRAEPVDDITARLPPGLSLSRPAVPRSGEARRGRT